MRIDLTGQVFGRLTAIRYAGNTGWRKSKEALWECQCSCGNSKIISASDLKRGASRSCGCLRSEVSREKLKDLTSLRFGKLVVIARDLGRSSRYVYWRCICDCGNITSVVAASLISGKTVSCGCHRKSQHITHGKSNTKIYTTYKNMMGRCYSPKSASFNRYGARGIKVCLEWHDFLIFAKWAEASGFKEDLEIDRIDNSRGYSPDNCRWVTGKEQHCNRDCTRLIEYLGEVKTIQEWASTTGLPIHVITGRFFVRGWSAERTLSTPLLQAKKPDEEYLIDFNGESKRVYEWAREKNIKYATLRARLYIYKWPVEKALNTPVRTEKRENA